MLGHCKWSNGLHLYSAFPTSGHSKYFTTLPNIHPFMHTFTQRWRCQPCKTTASSSGAVRVRRLAQGHLDTLGGAGDRPSNHPTTSQPALPPEPHSAPCMLTMSQEPGVLDSFMDGNSWHTDPSNWVVIIDYFVKSMWSALFLRIYRIIWRKGRRPYLDLFMYIQ